MTVENPFIASADKSFRPSGTMKPFSFAKAKCRDTDLSPQKISSRSLEGAANPTARHETADMKDAEGSARLYARQGELGKALDVYEELLQSVSSSPARRHLLEAARIHLRLARSTQQANMCRQHLHGALRHAQRCRSEVTRHVTGEALVVLENIYRIASERCSSDLTADSFLDDLILTAHIAETSSRPSIQVPLLQAMVRGNQWPIAWDYIVAKRMDMAYCQEWTRCALQNMDAIRQACASERSPLDILELDLWLKSCYLRNMLEDSYPVAAASSVMDETMKGLKDVLEDLDNLFPLPDVPNQSRWRRLKLEYLAFLHLVRALRKCKAATASVTNVSQLMNCSAEIGNAFAELRLCLSYRQPHVDAPSQLLSGHRISTAAHFALSLLRCFSLEWLLNRGQVSPGVSGFVLSEELPDLGPAIPCLAESVSTSETDNIELRSTLEWLKSEKLFAVDCQYLTTHPWALSHVVDVAGWLLHDDRLRPMLRDIFPRMTDSAPGGLFSRMRAGKRVTPTISDVEAFILILLAQRDMLCRRSVSGVSTSGQVLCLAALGCWKPTVVQLKFWRNMLMSYGQKSWQSYDFPDSMMEEHEITQAIQELRGLVRCTVKASMLQLHQRRNIYAIVGLMYAQVRRLDEAEGFLSRYNGWDDGTTIDERECDAPLVLLENDQIGSFNVNEDVVRRVVGAIRDMRKPRDLPSPMQVKQTFNDQTTLMEDSSRLTFDRMLHNAVQEPESYETPDTKQVSDVDGDLSYKESSCMVTDETKHDSHEDGEGPTPKGKTKGTPKTSSPSARLSTPSTSERDNKTAVRHTSDTPTSSFGESPLGSTITGRPAVSARMQRHLQLLQQLKAPSPDVSALYPPPPIGSNSVRSAPLVRNISEDVAETIHGNEVSSMEDAIAKAEGILDGLDKADIGQFSYNEFVKYPVHELDNGKSMELKEEEDENLNVSVLESMGMSLTATPFTTASDGRRDDGRQNGFRYRSFDFSSTIVSVQRDVDGKDIRLDERKDEDQSFIGEFTGGIVSSHIQLSKAVFGDLSFTGAGDGDRISAIDQDSALSDGADFEEPRGTGSDDDSYACDNREILAELNSYLEKADGANPKWMAQDDGAASVHQGVTDGNSERQAAVTLNTDDMRSRTAESEDERGFSIQPLQGSDAATPSSFSKEAARTPTYASGLNVSRSTRIPVRISPKPLAERSTGVRTAQLELQSNHFTPQRNPMELIGGRGDLSELRRRGVVKECTGLLKKVEDDEQFEDKASISKPTIRRSARLSRQLALLEDLRNT
ncbi:hypothetical protein BC832DRAFT_559783 [Gaertneriomyces semiglobifer]|nr:hypothetical protein BC832DRAFT_559783 [Gaertneriomyces semiglobifer]